MVKFARREHSPAPSAASGAPSQEFRWPVRVYYEDTDTGGVVYYANYLRFMERARTEWLRVLGFEHASMREQYGALFIVRAAEMKYISPARLDDSLQIGVQALGRSAFQIFLKQDVVRQSQLLVRGEVAIACVDSMSFKPKMLPQPLITLLGDLK